MIDIRRNDTFVAQGKSYNVKSVDTYSGMSLSPAFARALTMTASVQRRPSAVDGERGSLQTVIPMLKCTPLDPVQSDLQLDPGLKQPHVLLQTFCGDNEGFLKLIVQDKDLA